MRPPTPPATAFPPSPPIGPPIPSLEDSLKEHRANVARCIQNGLDRRICNVSLVNRYVYNRDLQSQLIETLVTLASDKVDGSNPYGQDTQHGQDTQQQQQQKPHHDHHHDQDDQSDQGESPTLDHGSTTSYSQGVDSTQSTTATTSHPRTHTKPHADPYNHHHTTHQQQHQQGQLSINVPIFGLNTSTTATTTATANTSTTPYASSHINQQNKSTTTNKSTTNKPKQMVDGPRDYGSSSTQYSVDQSYNYNDNHHHHNQHHSTHLAAKITQMDISSHNDPTPPTTTTTGVTPTLTVGDDDHYNDHMLTDNDILIKPVQRKRKVAKQTSTNQR